MIYDLFADRCEGGEVQRFGTIELTYEEDDQMIQEIVDCLNGYNFRDCVITYAEKQADRVAKKLRGVK